MCKGACKGICRSKKVECKKINGDLNNSKEPLEFLDPEKNTDDLSVEGENNNNLDKDELHNNEQM